MQDGLVSYIAFVATGALRAALGGYYDKDLPRLLWMLAHMEAFAELQGLPGEGGMDGVYREELPRSDVLTLPLGMVDYEIYYAALGQAEKLSDHLGLEPYDGAKSRERLAREFLRWALRAQELDRRRGHDTEGVAEALQDLVDPARALVDEHYGEDVAVEEAERTAAEAYPPNDDEAAFALTVYRGSRGAWLLFALLSCPPD